MEQIYIAVDTSQLHHKLYFFKVINLTYPETYANIST